MQRNHKYVTYHYKFAWSSCLFALITDELTRPIQNEVPWGVCVYIYIVNDTILVDEIKHGVNVKLEVRRDALESNCFWRSRTKTKYMKCKFSKRRNKDEEVVKLDA